MHKEDVVHTYDKILLSHKKNKMMLFVATHMDLDVITLREARQTKTHVI